MKRILMIIIIIFGLGLNNVNGEELKLNKEEVIPSGTVKEIVLYNLDEDKITFEVDKDSKVQVASLTKIMTAIIAIEHIDNLDEKITISSNVFKGTYGYSKAGFQIGDTVTYKDLLYGVLLPSGADAVNAVVLNSVGDKEKFIKLMNDKVKELGLKNTHFDNPVGEDSDNNYSSAYDIAKILEYALNNKNFEEIFTTKQYTTTNGLHFNSTLNTYSKYTTLDISNIKGSKSGFTDGAGRCLASISTIDNINYLLVTLGSTINDSASAIKDSVTVYDYFDKNYDYRDVINKNKVIKSIPVKWGHIKKYNIKSNKDIQLYLRNDIDLNKLEYIYKGIEELNYKIHKGTKLGVVDIKYEGKVLTSLDIYLNQEIDYYHPVIYTIITIGVILLIIFIRLKLLKLKKKKHKRRKRKSKR